MFDFDAGKLIMIGIVALIVIGPKDLPRVLRELGRAVGKMRRMAAEFQGQFMEAVREADMADIKADVAKLAESAKVNVPFDPVADIKKEVKGAIDGTARPSQSPETGADLMKPLAAPPAPAALLPQVSEARQQADLPDSPLEEPATRGPNAPEGVDAEMRALAQALEAEIRDASHVKDAASPGAFRREPDSTLQNNA